MTRAWAEELPVPNCGAWLASSQWFWSFAVQDTA